MKESVIYSETEGGAKNKGEIMSNVGELETMHACEKCGGVITPGVEHECDSTGPVTETGEQRLEWPIDELPDIAIALMERENTARKANDNPLAALLWRVRFDLLNTIIERDGAEAKCTQLRERIAEQRKVLEEIRDTRHPCEEMECYPDGWSAKAMQSADYLTDVQDIARKELERIAELEGKDE